jgi:hypothetical protein
MTTTLREPVKRISAAAAAIPAIAVASEEATRRGG